MMPKSAPPEHDHCHPTEPSVHRAGQDAESVHEKPPAANFLVPLVPSDDIHGQVVSPAEQQLPLHPSTPSPATSTAEEKGRDVELGRASFTAHQVNHETPIAPIGSDVVDWESPEDPSNPVNWSAGLKVANGAVVSAITFIT